MTEIAEPDIIKALSCDLFLGEFSLDAYMLPDGEKRLGVEGTSRALGYTKRWFYNRTKRQSKWLKGLQNNGFTGAQLEVRVLRQEQDKTFRGASIAKTMSVRDFSKLVTHEAVSNHNARAVILLAIFFEVGLERILDDVFAGRSIEFLLEKIVHYTRWTYEEFQEVLRYNREEVRTLYPWKGRELFGRSDPNLNN